MPDNKFIDKVFKLFTAILLVVLLFINVYIASIYTGNLIQNYEPPDVLGVLTAPDELVDIRVTLYGCILHVNINLTNQVINIDLYDHVTGTFIGTFPVTIDGVGYGRVDVCSNGIHEMGGDYNFCIKYGVNSERCFDNERAFDTVESSVNFYIPGEKDPSPTLIEDDESPIVNFQNIHKGDCKVKPDSKVIIHVKDKDSGVDLETVIITINGVEYPLLGNSNVSYSGGTKNLLIKVQPIDPFFTNKINRVVIEGADIAGNTFRDILIFNNPLKCGFIPPDDDDEDDDDDDDDVRPGRRDRDDDREEEDEDDEKEAQQAGEEEPEEPEDLYIEKEEEFYDEVDNALPIIAIALILPRIVSFIPGLYLIILGWGKNPWGGIINKSSGAPILFADCKLYNQNNNKVVEKSKSNADGIYKFRKKKGKYRLEIEHPDYEKYIREVDVDKDGLLYVEDVRLEPIKTDRSNVDKVREQIKQQFKIYNKKIRNIMIFGAITIIVGVLRGRIHPLNYVAGLLYIGVLAYDVFQKSALFGHATFIKNILTSYELPNVFVRIYNASSKELVDVVKTNNLGAFKFGKKGDYLMHFSKKDFDFFSLAKGESFQDMKKEMVEGVDLIKAKFEDIKGNNIFLDKTEQ